jgi:hypothetical protein
MLICKTESKSRRVVMDSGGMPANWTPPEPPAVGSSRWLDDMAFSFMIEAFNGLPDHSGVFELPKVLAGGKTYKLGYFVLRQAHGGADYFRVDSIQPVPVRPIAATEREDSDEE